MQVKLKPDLRPRGRGIARLDGGGPRRAQAKGRRWRVMALKRASMFRSGVPG